MKIYLSTTQFIQIEDLLDDSDILIAYPYIRKGGLNLDKYLPRFRNFILDSGVFTMINSGKRFDLNSYADEYADYVKEKKIKQYVELDVDQIIGVEKTRALRDRIEKRVGWQSIPVWHTVRGKESFIQDCKDYKYIALGYFLTEGLPSSLTKKYAKAFIDTAHSYGCRVHGLGFTKTKELHNIPFDSVDSSNWVASRRFGILYKFDPSQRIMRQYHPNDRRMIRCVMSL